MDPKTLKENILDFLTVLDESKSFEKTLESVLKSKTVYEPLITCYDKIYMFFGEADMAD
jgi:predicted component of type VI protein secretion system